MPGVQSASVAQVAALTGNASSRTIQVQGYEPKPDENMNPWTNEIGTGLLPHDGHAARDGPRVHRARRRRRAAGRHRQRVVRQVLLRRTRTRSASASASASMNNPGAIEIVGVVRGLALRRHAAGHDGDENDDAALRLHAVSAEQRAERDDGLRAVERRRRRRDAGAAAPGRAPRRRRRCRSSRCSRWTRPWTRRSSTSACSRCCRRPSACSPRCSPRSASTA